MKKGIITIVLLSIFSCIWWWFWKNKISDYKYIISCQESTKEKLKDPFSVRWWEWKITSKHIDPNTSEIITVFVTQEYHAKNSYGAYWKDEQFCEISSDLKNISSYTQEEKILKEKSQKKKDLEQKIQDYKSKMKAKWVKSYHIQTAENVLDWKFSIDIYKETFPDFIKNTTDEHKIMLNTYFNMLIEYSQIK